MSFAQKIDTEKPGVILCERYAQKWRDVGAQYAQRIALSRAKRERRADTATSAAVLVMRRRNALRLFASAVNNRLSFVNPPGDHASKGNPAYCSANDA
jgi:acetoin utilization deacetylase AcuC-like enzyme